MKEILHFFTGNWSNILMIGVGTLALVVYKLQKRNEKRNAAILVISQINELKEKIGKIVEIISNNQLNATGIYETLDILDDNQWNKYKHLFVGNIDSNSIRIINDFYEGVSLIREQLVLAKKLQQQAFFNNQQMLTNNCNYFLMQEYENNTKLLSSNYKDLLESIPTTNENEEKLKKASIQIFDTQFSVNNSKSQILNRYFQKVNDIKTLFGTDGLFISYLPEQIHVTIEKELDKLAQIEIIGCEGFRNLKKIAKIK